MCIPSNLIMKEQNLHHYFLELHFTHVKVGMYDVIGVGSTGAPVRGKCYQLVPHQDIHVAGHNVSYCP